MFCEGRFGRATSDEGAQVRSVAALRARVCLHQAQGLLGRRRRLRGAFAARIHVCGFGAHFVGEDRGAVRLAERRFVRRAQQNRRPAKQVADEARQAAAQSQAQAGARLAVRRPLLGCGFRNRKRQAFEEARRRLARGNRARLGVVGGQPQVRVTARRKPLLSSLKFLAPRKLKPKQLPKPVYPRAARARVAVAARERTFAARKLLLAAECADGKSRPPAARRAPAAGGQRVAAKSGTCESARADARRVRRLAARADVRRAVDFRSVAGRRAGAAVVPRERGERLDCAGELSCRRGEARLELATAAAAAAATQATQPKAALAEQLVTGTNELRELSTLRFV